jgi:hypothetical protein
LIRGHPDDLEKAGFRLSPAFAEAASRRQAGMTLLIEDGILWTDTNYCMSLGVVVEMNLNDYI